MHLPFCAHRCGYCDFVTVTGRAAGHGAYVDALLAELALEGRALAPALDSVFVGGGTPTYTEPAALARLLAVLPAAGETTVEANPETVTPAVAGALAAAGVTRVSLGAQTFQPRLLETLERRATPAVVRAAVTHLRAAGISNLSLDLVYGIPGQTPADLDADLAAALALEPEHLSAYELEAKPGTRFTIAHGEELARQADAMEGYFERVVEALEAAGYRWYETASFCRRAGRDLRARHNLGYWLGHDYLGIGIGAVSTIAGVRRRNGPGLAAYVEALAKGRPPPRETEALDAATRAAERVLLGLRLDEPLALDAAAEAALDPAAVERLASHRLLVRGPGTLALTRRGRFLGGAVTAEALAYTGDEEERT